MVPQHTSAAIAPPVLPLDRRFGGVINQLFVAVGACVFNASPAGPLIRLITRRLHRDRTRFFSLFARYAAGKLPAAPRKPRKPRARRPEGTPARPPPVDPLPRNFGWLLRLVSETVSGRGLLLHLVQTAEMAEFLAAAPQAARILRPLCRMLNIRPPPVLMAPKRQAKPPKPPAARKAPQAPCPRPRPVRLFAPLAPPPRQRRAPRACGPPSFPA